MSTDLLNGEEITKLFEFFGRAMENYMDAQQDGYRILDSIADAVAEAYPDHLVVTSEHYAELRNAALAAQPLLEACERFVWKVENDLAQSRESYSQMKSAIALAKGERADSNDD